VAISLISASSGPTDGGVRYPRSRESISKILHLDERSLGNVQETGKILVALSLRPFRNVCRNRSSGSAELSNQPILLVCG
jgi:hypothetical protein